MSHVELTPEQIRAAQADLPQADLPRVQHHGGIEKSAAEVLAS